MDRVKNHLKIGKIADILVENRRIGDKIEHGTTHGQEGKCWDISAIHRVSGGIDMIFCGEKSEGRNFYKNC